ncbi:MAG TPA: Lrp/AsnC family transcriptional regulator [Methylomusa anaerophila]|uniref:Leucine-responsive regulatory protein n=1 Tax=Methylomusa anaerophila TaxID=1930071 RepID=A0A348AHY6_9FIRM|nr:Lrp/AsnC family transcriptional regulator [Methylomusa anaerophila]BBB90684.1 leucine-responsive regulatory protein [Methylomusa anaerophila]HML88710.1 Lrp/AsnC family transcriptional regulator [Methylomusa anaerophila]
MLNSIDLKLVGHLMNYGRTTWAELGTLLDLSAPAAAERVRKLEEKGIIKGFTAIIDPESVGYGLLALIAVTLERCEHKDAFLARIGIMPEIQECHHVAGQEDYILKVRCTGTHDLERIISNEIKIFPGAKTRTTIILSTIKETPILPLPTDKG